MVPTSDSYTVTLARQAAVGSHGIWILRFTEGMKMGTTLDYPVFDADNHMYEQADAFTRYLPDEYKNAVKVVQINGRD